jgi:uncharacterized membrane protein YhaH (DUF805 family)
MRADARRHPPAGELVALLVTVKRLRDADRPTAPLRTALPQLALALVVLAVGLALELRWVWLVTAACCLVGVGLLRAGRASIERRRRRATDERPP